MWVQSTCASSATSASTSTDMWRTDGYLLRFEPCVLPKMSLFPCHHVVSDCVCVQRTLWFQTPFYCYCAHECATQKKCREFQPNSQKKTKNTSILNVFCFFPGSDEKKTSKIFIFGNLWQKKRRFPSFKTLVVSERISTFHL